MPSHQLVDTGFRKFILPLLCPGPWHARNGSERGYLTEADSSRRVVWYSCDDSFTFEAAQDAG